MAQKKERSGRLEIRRRIALSLLVEILAPGRVYGLNSRQEEVDSGLLR